MADAYAHEITRGLRYQHGCIVKPTPTIKQVDEPGAADLMVAKGGRVAMIEVKTGKGGPGAGAAFAFGDWRDNQREWAATYCRAEPYATEYWIGLIMGIHAPNTKPWKTVKGAITPNTDSKGIQYMPRTCWLVPYEVWLDVEGRIRPYQDSIPYRAAKGYNTALQQKGYDAITLLSDWQLERGDNMFIVPVSHPFHEMYLGAAPLPLFHATKEGIYAYTRSSGAAARHD